MNSSVRQFCLALCVLFLMAHSAHGATIYGYDGTNNEIVSFSSVSGALATSFPAPFPPAPYPSGDFIAGLDFSKVNGGELLVGSVGDSTILFRLNPSTGALIAAESTSGVSILAGIATLGLTPDIWYLNNGLPLYHQVGFSGPASSVGPATQDGFPGGLGGDGNGRIFVFRTEASLGDSNGLSEVNPVDGTTLKTVLAAPLTGNGRITGIAFDGAEVFLCDGSNIIYVVDPNTLTPIRTITGPVGRTFYGLAAGSVVVSACRPPKSGKFPCGPALSSFLATGAYTQFAGNETCEAFNSTQITPFCGAQPVKTEYAFTLNNTGAVGNATFSTADGSCTCSWCYEINNFEEGAYCFVNEAGWEWSNPAAAGFYDSASGSFGINFNTWTGENSTLTATETIRKRYLSFWIRTAFRTGDYLQFSIDGVVPPASYVTGCPYTDVAGQRWTGTLACTVQIDVSYLSSFPCVSTLRWFASRNGAVSKRVDPVVDPVPVPALRGAWLDTVQGCGVNHP